MGGAGAGLYRPHPMMSGHPMMNMPMMGGGFYGHPVRTAWGGGANERVMRARASSPGSSTAPAAHGGAGGDGLGGSESKSTTASGTHASTGTDNGGGSGSGGSSRGGTNVLAEQMAATRLIFQKQLDKIREHIHETHARVQATAQAAGYQNYTTLAATQEYIKRMRAPAPLSFDEAMQTVDTGYEDAAKKG